MLNPFLTAIVFAALDTTSSALSATLHMLAKNPAIQNQLRGEINNASGDQDKIPSDVLADLPFLDAVCRKTLRLYVLLPIPIQILTPRYSASRLS
jgi:cytochrome P450